MKHEKLYCATGGPGGRGGRIPPGNGAKPPPVRKLYEVTYKPAACDTNPDELFVERGDNIAIHFTGVISEKSLVGDVGTQFDSSYDKDQPFEFTIGVGQALRGWDENLMGMCVGEKRRLVLPPEYAFGDQGAGEKVPGGATVQFDVELMSVKERTDVNVFEQIDADGSGDITFEELSAWFETHPAREEDPEAIKDAPQHLFAMEDQNQDGVISWEEFGGPKGRSNPMRKEL